MADDKDDAQVKNELGAIKAQLTATANPAELARLASAAAGLAASTNDPKLLEQIKGVQAAIAKKEETAEQNISSKIAAENLEAPQQPDHEAVREHLEHTEREKRIENNLAEFEKIEKEFHQIATEDRAVMRQAIDDPESLTDKQKRELKGEYLDEEEKREAERRTQIRINAATLSYQLEKDLKQSIGRDNKKIEEIKEKIKIEPNTEKKQVLENEKTQLEEQNKKRATTLKERVEPANNQRELDRQELKELAEKRPELAKKSIIEHFTAYIDQYKELAAEDPNHKGLEEMYDIVKKAGLEKELGVEKEIVEYQKSNIAKIKTSEKITSPNSQKETTKTASVKEDSVLTAQEKYGKGSIPPEIKNNITEKKIVKLGYENDLQAIKGKLPAIQVSQPKSAQIDPPYPTPAMAKFAARAKGIT
ncbi:MAG TPA: hypothetical protein LFW20_01900 [Rickettsia endosymbiont of Omalisus fontisbellaquei]|nr:hypothetical protein [Rickettsia endosymbiont of Omalisus fontisbellaquei]